MKRKQRLRQSIAMWMMASWLMIPLPLQAAGNPVPDNMTLPTGGEFVNGSGTIREGALSDSQKNGVMDVKQDGTNAVITWNDFSIGANAQVNFSKNGGGTFNTLNYVTGSNMSQIYGKMNAKDGNIYLVNPNGVQIGNSAEINVGSLYVSNKKLNDTQLNQLGQGNTDTINTTLKSISTTTNAELMSLGYIDATKVTFDGNRIVIDVDRLNQKTNGNFNLDVRRTGADTDKDFNLVLGTDNKNNIKGTILVSHNSTQESSIIPHTYQWIHNADELGKINQHLHGNYALRNAIDLTGKSFASIGSEGNAFTGKLDGLGNNIFGLKGSQGLFGVTDGAKIGHFNLISGTTGVSIEGTAENIGALIGHAQNTRIEDVTNTLDVAGNTNVGGLVGKAENSNFYNVINTGHIKGHENVGGIIGNMSGGTLGQGESTSDAVNVSHNMGKVEGFNNERYSKKNKLGNYSNPEKYYSHHIGGLVGYASDAVIGNTNGSTISNLTHISGGYDVGGIVGRAQDTQLYNLSNEGDILANGYKLGDYIFHTDYTYNGYREADGYHKVQVRTANAGGIVGSISVSKDKDNNPIEGHTSRIENVTNSGDVTTTTEHYKSENGKDDKYMRYTAGNVGGIVGRARNTDIDTATNRGNHVYGAHNVGGIAGFFGRDDTDKNAITKQLYYRIRNAVNDGGDIMGTGAVGTDGGFSREIIRSDYTSLNEENYITGNIGGIAGMVSGVHLLIANSGNRGKVHSYIKGLIDDTRELDTSVAASSTDIPMIAETANVGGIVGKIDRSQLFSITGKTTLSAKLAEIKKNLYTAGITGSYNAGIVAGYANIGGIVGMSYNNSIASSYNIGNIYTTRISNANRAPANIGGIVGDTTEHSSARTILYDVFNSGKIGTEDFTYYGRHVGGIVGRLSGIVEKAYNTGEIYNGANTVGGIAGWWYSGYIKNAFNTGNITVLDKNKSGSDTSKVGGIVGGADLAGGNLTSGAAEDMMISYAYNLGTLRSFIDEGNNRWSHPNAIGGIIGGVYVYGDPIGTGKFSLSNVYSTGNAAAFIWDSNKNSYVLDNEHQGAIIGTWGSDHDEDKVTNDKGQLVMSKEKTRENRYHVRENVFFIKNTDNQNYIFGTPKGENPEDYIIIDFANRFSSTAYNTNSKDSLSKVTGNRFTFYNGLAAIKSHPDSWRIDDGSGLPVLNAFYTDTDKFKTADGNNLTNLGKKNGVHITHGTAYNPYLTIVTIDRNAVTDTSLFSNNSLLLDAQNKLEMRDSLAVYGAGLTLNNFSIDCTTQTENHLNLYGGLLYSDGALQLNSDAKKTNNIVIGKSSSLYGSSVTMNFNNSPLTIFGEVTATGTDTADADNGNININAGSLESYWKLNTAKQGQTTEIVGGNIMDKDADYTESNANDPKTTMKDIKTYYSRTTGEAMNDGDLTIHTKGSTYLLYGNMKQGQTTVHGDMNITADTGDIYVDTDLYVGGSINLKGDHNLILDVTHVGARDNTDKTVEHEYGTAETVQNFFTAHQDDAHKISFTKNDGTTSSQAKIALDMWVNGDETDDSQGNFDFGKFDINGTADKSKLQDVLGEYKDLLYYWVKNEYQLKDIQDAAIRHTDENILNYHFALKNNIEASALGDSYQAIGSGENAFTGIFDGMDNAIIGLKSEGGIFGNVSDAHISNLKIYASEFTGDTVGAVASKATRSSVSEITGLGNTIVGTTSVGGLVGELGLYANLDTSSDQSTVIAKVNDSAGTIFAGGLVGKNTGGFIYNGSTNSDVTIDESNSNEESSKQLYLGGIVGSNNAEKYDFGDNFYMYFGGEIENTSSHGVTGKTSTAKATVGGIAGVNNGYIKNGYNESVIYGNAGVGGIAGKNTYNIKNVTNALAIDGSKGSDIGGIVGIQEDNTEDSDRKAYIESGRNTATIHGDINVGGIVGNNSQNSQLHNLENGFMAEIIGRENVGGIAGTNAGIISADGMELINSGTISGNRYVGGVVGINKGTIQNISTDITLKTTGENAQFFGGIAGWNDKTGIIENAKNKSTILAPDADYVGGIVGKNSGTLQGMENTSSGKVIGGSHVGGIVGLNESAIKATPVQKTETVTIVEKHPLFEMDESGRYKLDSNGYPIPVYEKNADGTIKKDANNNPIQAVEIENKTITKPLYEKDEQGNDKLDSPIYKYVNTRISNEGTVIATKGGAGGIIGTNKADLTQVTMINHGDVHGNGATSGDGTGGLIGTNRGIIRYSSLINSLNGQVTGISNVGGLIGVNTGIIEGGRKQNTDHDLSKDDKYAVDTGYYANTIYNNGTIRIGSYTKNVNGDYVLGVTNADSQNIGGLVGDNQGKLTAGYNTGVIEAGNSTNVGGIAGRNSGTIDQVFTNVMTKDGTNQNITGKENVGGIVGNNEVKGHVSNAYTAKDTNVTGTTAGLIAGTNAGTISNVYANGKLIGHNSIVSNGKDISQIGTDWTKSDSYKTDDTSFDFTNTWKIYEDHTNPLLKVFLTKANVNDDVLNDLTYNGKNQLDVEQVVKNSMTNQKDDTTFADYNKNKDLIQGDEFKNAGTYQNWLWSGQIGKSTNDNGFDPNVLGYDFDVQDKTIAKKSLTVTLGDISRVYGNSTISNNGNYNFNVSGWVEGEEYLRNNLSFKVTKDDALKKADADGKVTSDVGEYGWNIELKNLDANYTVDPIMDGKSNVTQANLEISLKDISRVYGDLASKNYSSEWEYKNGTKLVNGDTGLIVSATNDGAIKEGTIADIKKTENAGDYTWEGTLGGVANLNKNYKVKVNDQEGLTGSAASKVTKANLVINLKDISRIYGNLDAKDYSNEYTYGDNTNLVNGDTGLVVSATKDEAIAEGTLEDVKKTKNVSDSYSWSGVLDGVTNLYMNYNVTVRDGKSAVTKAKLTVGLNEVHHTYGDMDLKDGYSYGLSTVTGNVNGDSYGLSDMTVAKDSDNALTGKLTGKVTNDVGNYTWTGSVSSTNALLNQNYEIEAGTGVSVIDKAKLNLTVGNANTTYGTKFDESQYGYTLSGNTNGDSEEIIKKLIGSVSYTNSAAKDGTNGKWTADAGQYAGAIDLNKRSDQMDLKNYEVGEIVKGTATVDKATLNLTVGDANTTYGTKFDENQYGYTLSGNTNGDSEEIIKNLIGNVGYTNSAAKDGTNGTWTDNAGTYTNAVGLGKTKEEIDLNLKNYEVDSITNGTATIGKAKLNVTVGNANTTYGTKFDENQYGYTLSGNTNGDSEEIIKNLIGNVGYTNSAAKDGTNGTWTDNAGTYTNAVGLGKTKEEIDLNLKNYEVDSITNGTATISKAKLTVGLNEVHRTYGDMDLKDGYSYGASSITGNVNGDNYNVADLIVTKDSDKALTGKLTGKVTNDAGNYTWTGSVSSTKALLNKNYEIEAGTGVSVIDKAQLRVRTDDQTITVGQKPNYTGTLSGLVNGDSEETLGKLIYGIDDAQYEQTAGTYIGVIRTVNDGKYGELPSSYRKNYDFTYDWGNLIVQRNARPSVPDTVEAFDYLFYDTPWDKQRNFRERRAELHFVDGGVNVSV